MVSKIALVGIVLACMVVSAAETYSCYDCGPLGFSRNPSSINLSRGLQILNNDPDIYGQESHSADTCPICLSQLVLPGSYAPVDFAPTNAVYQDPPRLSAQIVGSIYKPPCIAS